MFFLHCKLASGWMLLFLFIKLGAFGTLAELAGANGIPLVFVEVSVKILKPECFYLY